MVCKTSQNAIGRYALPPLSFVGGHGAEIEFNLKDEAGNPFDAEEYEAYLTACPRRERDASFTVKCSLFQDDKGSYSIFKAEIDPLKTVNLEGEFIYQLTIINLVTKRILPCAQGRMEIIRNIDPALVLKEE